MAPMLVLAVSRIFHKKGDFDALYYMQEKYLKPAINNTNMINQKCT